MYLNISVKIIIRSISTVFSSLCIILCMADMIILLVVLIKVPHNLGYQVTFNKFFFIGYL